ncbi:hypothetical protein BGY98DRAFT_472492 [Russula aff. rugulosa BPL654]|nr:hypothetical protein BGY98DRAFT_472492 [Russula aff. rugulosa BPL654]
MRLRTHIVYAAFAAARWRMLGAIYYASRHSGPYPQFRRIGDRGPIVFIGCIKAFYGWRASFITFTLHSFAVDIIYPYFISPLSCDHNQRHPLATAPVPCITI